MNTVCHPASSLVNVEALGPKLHENSSRPLTEADHSLTLCDLTG